MRCLAQVIGSKTVWIAPPIVSPFLTSSSANATLGNTSKVDVFAPSSSLSPEFVRKVNVKAMSAELGEGDMLFFPPGWWHAFRSESPSFSVSMWF